MVSESKKEKFISNAEAYWAPSVDGSARNANKHESANKKIVLALEKTGEAESFLTDLLIHEKHTVKFAAAGYLLAITGSESAAAVLCELRDSTHGLLSMGAKTMLEYYQSKNNN